MSNNLTDLADELFQKKLNTETRNPKPKTRNPVHVVYGGAHLFKHDTPQKFGKIALRTMDFYTWNFVELAKAVWLKGADTLPIYDEPIAELERNLRQNPEKVKTENYDAWFAWTIFDRVREKLQREPIEDFRIDFEDGYGFRTDEEEDSHAIAAAEQLAVSSQQLSVKTNFCGVRIKSFQPETYSRAVRTLDIFLSNLLKYTNSALPENFVVTLPKINHVEEVSILDELLSEFETQNNLPKTSIKIEIMIETPFSVRCGRELVEAANGRCVAAHFGAYDYTASFGITAVHQHLKHDACNFARNIMQLTLSPLGIRLSDSVTTLMPIPVNKGENLSSQQLRENQKSVHNALRLHFNNVTHSLINGFYQSWDLHPNQLIARYAAVYAFFLESFEDSAKRLRGFMDKATQATTTGNQFDDAASANGLLNYFSRAESCGAIDIETVENATNLTMEEIRWGNFARILENKGR